VTSAVTVAQGPTPAAVRVVTPAGSATLPGAFTLQPGLAAGSQLYVATDADTVAADESLSLREALLLATRGVGTFEVLRGAALTEQEKQRIQPQTFDGNGNIVLTQPPGPLAKDTIAPVGTYSSQVSVLTGSLPPLESGFDTVTVNGAKRFSLDAGNCQGPALTVNSDGNSVGGVSIASCPQAAIQVTGNGNSLSLLGATVELNAVGVQIAGGSNNRVSQGTLADNGIGVEVSGEAVGNALDSCAVKQTRRSVGDAARHPRPGRRRAGNQGQGLHVGAARRSRRRHRWRRKHDLCHGPHRAAGGR